MKDYKNYLGHYIDTLRELGMDIQNSKEELLDMILGLPGGYAGRNVAGMRCGNNVRLYEIHSDVFL